MLRALFGEEQLGLQFRGLLHITLAHAAGGIAFVQNPRNGGMNSVGAASQALRNVLDQREIRTRHLPRSLTAHKFHAPVFADFLDTPDDQQSDLAGAANVRPAAGLDVDALNLHRAEGSLAFGFLADSERRKFGRRSVPKMHGPVVKNDFVGVPFHALQLSVRE